GAYLDPSTGSFDWTPSFNMSGTYRLEFTAANGTTSTTVPATLHVLNANGAPEFRDVGAQQTQAGQALQFRVFAFDPDDPAYVPRERGIDGTLLAREGPPASVVYTATDVPAGAT